VPIGPITRARAKKLKKTLNGLVQNTWNKMDLEGLGKFNEHEGKAFNSSMIQSRKGQIWILI
jgi:hypothetical protein